MSFNYRQIKRLQDLARIREGVLYVNWDGTVDYYSKNKRRFRLKNMEDVLKIFGEKGYDFIMEGCSK